MEKLLCPDCNRELEIAEMGLSQQIITAICPVCRQSWHGLRENIEKLLKEPYKVCPDCGGIGKKKFLFITLVCKTCHGKKGI